MVVNYTQVRPSPFMANTQLLTCNCIVQVRTSRITGRTPSMRYAAFRAGTSWSPQTPWCQPTPSLRTAGFLPSTERMSYTCTLRGRILLCTDIARQRTRELDRKLLLQCHAYIYDHYPHISCAKISPYLLDPDRHPGSGKARSTCLLLQHLRCKTRERHTACNLREPSIIPSNRSVRAKSPDSDAAIVVLIPPLVVVHHRRRLRLDPKGPLYPLSILRRCVFDTSYDLPLTQLYSTPACRRHETEPSGVQGRVRGWSMGAKGWIVRLTVRYVCSSRKEAVLDVQICVSRLRWPCAVRESGLQCTSALTSSLPTPLLLPSEVRIYLSTLS